MENWRERRILPNLPGEPSNSRPSTSQYRAPNTRYFGLQRERRGAFRHMEELLELNHKNCNEIIMELTERLEDFSELLTSHLEPNKLVLIVSILAKVCLSCFRETQLAVLKVALNGSFLQSLEKYVRILKDQKVDNRNKYFWKNPKEFLDNLIIVCDSFIKLNQTDCCDILHKLLKVTELVPCPREGTIVEEWLETKSSIKSLMENLDLCKEKPQQEIGTLSVYPTSEEILTLDSGLTSKYFVGGKCDNVKDYLDEQVKLLKDRFAATLRKDIDKCIEHTQGPNRHRKCSTIRMYSDVVFGSMVFSWEKLGVIVNFSNKEDFQPIFSPLSICFKRGSVVCFTKDNFCTIFFGSVIQKDCGQHRLIIDFEPKYNSYEANVSYTMVECNVELQQYSYILKALISMSEDDFPLKAHFIDAVAEVEPPGYLDSTSSIHLGQGSRVDVFGNNWPSADQLKLDSTQYSAFRAALTQKFVMIQGAPGTGKTHLGLQIVKTLLHEDNQKLWYNETPILVVFLSNQILDQFLEGLISTTNRIIRVGQQSKNEKLESFTLKSARTRSSAGRNVMMVLNKRMKSLLKQLDAYQDCLNNIKNFNYILNFSNFRNIDEEIKSSWFSCVSNSDMLTWLFDGQCQDLRSLEISEIMMDILEEQKHFCSGEENAACGDKRNISDNPDRTILWSKSQIWTEIVQIRNELEKMETGTPHQLVKLRKLKETRLKHLWQNYQYCKMKMNDRGSAQSASKPSNVDYQSPKNMDPNDRWDLYFYWLNLYRHFVEEKFLELQDEHRQLAQKSIEIRDMLDLAIMKEALVLGMTFNAAARLKSTLKSLKCRIVVVGEACKVSDYYIMVSLTKHCESLILLDNHREPSPTAGKCSYSLGINIMERMMRNGLQCHVLRVQHRIRPEIAELFVPFNYPELENDHSVTKFPPVLGIPSCTYFIHHEHQDDDKYYSKVNMYEATFLVNLARYLRLVGYQAENITILAAYFGQTEILREESEKYEDLLQGVRISNVNSSQTQNSKIVLLSLVRNKAEGRIGRLEYQDFVISALSRAKEALYMMGNINLLCQHSQMWTKIKDVLVKQNCVGDYFPVCCQVNPDHITKIKEPKDFHELIEKVCSKICGRLLDCGHHCSKICHLMEHHCNCMYQIMMTV